MLGKTAGGLYWMFRFLERSENTARLIETGFRIALTRSSASESEWQSVVTTAAVDEGYRQKYDRYEGTHVVDYLLRDRDNPSSVMSVIEAARTNARLVRTALTTEVWEAVNENWLTIRDLIRRPVREAELPYVLGVIRRQSAPVRGALHGTMLRNDIYRFARIGTFLERADNTARIIDVKYYTLLPSASFVGSSLDNVQWETILRSASAHQAFRWLDEYDLSAAAIVDFLILDRRLPRSLAFSVAEIVTNLNHLAEEYGERQPCNDMADALLTRLKGRDAGSIFEYGLHQFIGDFIRDNNTVGKQVEIDYRFNR